MPPNNQRTIWKVVLAEHHQPTGKTTHWRDGEKLAPPKQLLIAQFAGGPDYYLLYLDEAGNELTDTCHDTEERAMRQAEFEFNVRRGDWIAVNG